MEIESYHRPEVYLKKCEIIWEESTKSHKDLMKNYLVFEIILVSFSGFMVFYRNSFGLITGTAALLCLFVIVNYFLKLKKSKEDFFSQAKEISEKYIKSNEPIKWSFSEGNFGYNDFQMSLNFNWEHFEKYQVKKDTLFLFQSREIESAITISKEEVGEENFREILEFIKTKIK